MKPTVFMTGLAGLAIAATASADVTINLTGSTAFRSATLTTIKSKYAVGNPANGPASFQFAHDKTAGNLNSSSRSIFIGNFPGITGVTTIRCTWTGSVEGIRALALAPANDPSPPTYLPPAACTVAASSTGGETAGVTNTPGTATSDIALSDVNKTSTPFSSTSLTTDAVGVIVFTMMANEGSTITNVTSQQYRALFIQGYQPLSLFTGNVSNTTNVFAVGRNDASGTRTTALAETGFGITNTVNQYVTTATSGNNITTLQLTPAGGAFASTVWGQDVGGNGGYTSGGNVATAMGLVGNSVNVLDDTGAPAFSAAHVDLVTWLGVGDAAAAKTAGAVLCAYNGVALDLAGAGNTLSTADTTKIANGSYTAWGFERMFRRPSPGADVTSAYNTIKSAIPANLGTAGLPISAVNVSRDADGGVVSPIN